MEVSRKGLQGRCFSWHGAQGLGEAGCVPSLSFNSPRLPASAALENKIVFQKQLPGTSIMHTIRLKGQDLIFKLKISSSNPINHGCFCLLIGLCHTSHVWISDTLFIPLLSPDIFTAPQKNLLELTHASHTFTACSFGLYFVTQYSLPCISLSLSLTHTHSSLADSLTGRTSH